MPMIDALVAEMEQEAASARRLLERIPAGQTDYKPHEKSMSLGALAGHLAEMFGWAHTVLQQDELDFESSDYEPFVADSSAAAVEKLDASVAAFQEAAQGVSDEDLRATWTMRSGGEVHMQMPRVAALRGSVLNHFVHHRGQLTVYLRLLDVPLPPVYGPTADEGSFA